MQEHNIQSYLIIHAWFVCFFSWVLLSNVLCTHKHCRAELGTSELFIHRWLVLSMDHPSVPKTVSAPEDNEYKALLFFSIFSVIYILLKCRTFILNVTEVSNHEVNYFVLL